jgi:hypothetical protein
VIIANPIYDTVFKRMMENERVAKFFIGTLLEQEIESVEVKPQEFTYIDELAGLAVFRLDFIATLRTEKGELKKVLIEIQNLIDEKKQAPCAPTIVLNFNPVFNFPLFLSSITLTKLF